MRMCDGSQNWTVDQNPVPKCRSNYTRVPFLPFFLNDLTYKWEKRHNKLIIFNTTKMLGNSSEYNNNGQTHHPRFLPKRIILLRHGESAGNIDGSAYTTTPDHKIPLTSQGIDQAKNAGCRIRQVISDSGECSNWKVYFYVSPYERTRSTLREIGRAFPKKRVIGVREECRVREQDFGNFQVAERMKAIKETRERFGRFYYRFPEGESAADVYDRVSSTFYLFIIFCLS